MAQTILGVDIGSYSVKVTELKRSLREFEITRFFESQVNQSPRLTHEEAASAALRTIIEKNELVGDVVSVSLPAHHLASRVIELPFTNVKKIEQTIEFELESHIPVPLEELLVDYHILSIDQERSTVLVAYVPRTRFMKYLDMLHVAGVDPKYIGIDSIDLSNMAQIAMVSQDAIYTLIDIGHQKTNVCVMQGTKLHYVRSVSIGGVHFTRAIQKAFRLSFDKAEALKLERGRVAAGGEDLDQISRICQKVVDELLVSLRQTYLGYRQIYPKTEWAAIYLTGGTSRLRGIAEFISAAFHLNVSTLDFLDFVDHKLQHPEGCREVMAPSMAQTLRVIFSNKAVKINFRRGEFVYQKDIKALGGEIKQLAVWFSIVFVLAILNFGFSYYTLNQKIKGTGGGGLAAVASKAIPELKTQKNQSPKQLLNVINSKIAELESQVQSLEGDDNAAQPLALLLEISKKIPSHEELSIDIDDFSFTGEHVRLEGRTTSFESVDKLKNALSPSSYFKNVATQNVAKGIRDEIKFSLSIEIAGIKQEES